MLPCSSLEVDGLVLHVDLRASTGDLDHVDQDRDRLFRIRQAKFAQRRHGHLPHLVSGIRDGGIVLAEVAALEGLEGVGHDLERIAALQWIEAHGIGRPRIVLGVDEIDVGVGITGFSRTILFEGKVLSVWRETNDLDVGCVAGRTKGRNRQQHYG